MAKLTIEEIPQPKPPKKYILELNEAELGLLQALVGTTSKRPGMQMALWETVNALFNTFDKADLFDTPYYTTPADSLHRGRCPRFE